MPYDSFRDRTPAGALVAGSTVTFHLHGEAEASLVLAADGQAPQAYTMPADTTGLTVTVTVPTAGLWFYGFTTASGWLGPVAAGRGGPSAQYAGPDGAPWYQLTVVTRMTTVPAWYQDASIYHIFVDRFNNGNADGHVNAPKPNSFLYGQLSDEPYYVKDAAGEVVRWDFYGGNLAGITAKLPLLAARGYTALYLSPIFEATSNHRYDTGDYFTIDPMLGTLADFKALVAALHARGMHLILDGVFNHVGRDSRYFNALGRYPTVGAAQSPASPYYDWFTFKHYPDDYASWWSVRDLPAINKGSQSFHDFIAGGPDSVIGYWTGLGVDGWRLDVVDELAPAFVTQIRRLLDQYPERVLIGEVWEDASNKVAYGQRRAYLQGDQLQAVMNYPQRAAILDFARGTLTAGDLLRQLLTLQENYPPATFAYNFTSLSTHDTPRLKTVLAVPAQWRQAVLLWTVLPGNRVTYYGDEAGLTGGPAPANRKYYPWHREDPASLALYDEARQWRTHPALHGAAAFFPFTFGAGFGVLRTAEKQGVLALFNPTAAPLSFNPAAVDLTAVPAAWQPLLAAQTVPANGQRLLELTLPGGESVR